MSGEPRDLDLRILIVCHYFRPEIGAPQARLSELAAHWATSGHDVTVLTGLPNHPTGVVPAEYRGRATFDEHRDGYRVVRTWLYATRNEGFVKKTLGHLSFMVTSVLLGLRRIGPNDVVVVSSPTFFSILSAWLIARRRRARFVVEVRDLWPAIFVELGVLTNRTVIRFLERLELAAYRVADGVVVVTKGFKDDLVRRGVPEDKVTVITNGVDWRRFASPQGDVPGARDAMGASADEVLVLYIGAHGISHSLGTVLDAADRLPAVRFALVGEGAAKADLERRAASLGLANLVMLPAVAPDEVPTYLAASDICVVTLRKIPLFQTFIPSKLFELLAASRPVVAAVEGEPASILRDAGAMVVEPEDSEALASAIAALAPDATRRAAMGARGATYVREHYDRAVLAERYLDLLASLVDTP
jgi:glycosyltransferase involved in cell wall biosynthesis